MQSPAGGSELESVHTVGAVVGGLIWEIVGGLAGEGMTQPGHWFFGGSSRLSAVKILGLNLLASTGVVVQKQLSTSGKNVYVHRVLSSHISEERRAQVTAAEVAEEMVATKSVLRVEVEVM